jgi:hypothetical protein
MQAVEDILAHDPQLFDEYISIRMEQTAAVAPSIPQKLDDNVLQMLLDSAQVSKPYMQPASPVSRPDWFVRIADFFADLTSPHRMAWAGGLAAMLLVAVIGGRQAGLMGGTNMPPLILAAYESNDVVLKFRGGTKDEKAVTLTATNEKAWREEIARLENEISSLNKKYKYLSETLPKSTVLTAARTKAIVEPPSNLTDERREELNDLALFQQKKARLKQIQDFLSGGAVAPLDGASISVVLKVNLTLINALTSYETTPNIKNLKKIAETLNHTLEQAPSEIIKTSGSNTRFNTDQIEAVQIYPPLWGNVKSNQRSVLGSKISASVIEVEISNSATPDKKTSPPMLSKTLYFSNQRATSAIRLMPASPPSGN